MKKDIVAIEVFLIDLILLLLGLSFIKLCYKVEIWQSGNHYLIYTLSILTLALLEAAFMITKEKWLLKHK